MESSSSAPCTRGLAYRQGSGCFLQTACGDGKDLPESEDRELKINPFPMSFRGSPRASWIKNVYTPRYQLILGHSLPPNGHISENTEYRTLEAFYYYCCSSACTVAESGKTK